MRRRLLGAALVSVVALSLAPAGASHVVVRDPDDATGILDIKKVFNEHIENPRFTIRTFSPWRIRDMWDAGYFLVWFDTFGTERFDYYALLRSNGKEMKGTLWRYRAPDKPDRRIRYLKAYKPGPRKVATVVPLAAMRQGLQRPFLYRWEVESILTNHKCPNVCFDRAPDGEAVVEPRPPETP